MLMKAKTTRRQERGVSTKILRIMQERPGHTFTVDECALVFKARHPEKHHGKTTIQQRVYVAFADLHNTGDIVKVARGQYCFKAPQAPAPISANLSANLSANGSHGSQEPTPEPMLAPAATAVLLSLPQTLDADMKQLVDALYESLHTIEQIVTRHQRLFAAHHDLRSKLRELAGSVEATASH